MNNNYVLYLHIAPNGKKYFGITRQEVNKRWLNGKGYKNNEHFTRAINKYGWNNMQHVILADKLLKEEACFFEQIMIALYDTTNPNNGYNKSAGGEYGISGCKRTKEWNRKISEAKKGKYTGEKCYLYGKTGHNHPKSKSVICITTGYCFGSTGEAARWLNLNNDGGGIRQCCNGKSKSAGTLPNGEPLVWRYISDLPRPQLTDSDKIHLRDLLDKYGRASA